VGSAEDPHKKGFDDVPEIFRVQPHPLCPQGHSDLIKVPAQNGDKRQADGHHKGHVLSVNVKRLEGPAQTLNNPAQVGDAYRLFIALGDIADQNQANGQIHRVPHITQQKIENRRKKDKGQKRKHVLCRGQGRYPAKDHGSDVDRQKEREKGPFKKEDADGVGKYGQEFYRIKHSKPAFLAC
jgi:hypothetical protein